MAYLFNLVIKVLLHLVIKFSLIDVYIGYH